MTGVPQAPMPGLTPEDQYRQLALQAVQNNQPRPDPNPGVQPWQADQIWREATTQARVQPAYPPPGQEQMWQPGQAPPADFNAGFGGDVGVMQPDTGSPRYSGANLWEAGQQPIVGNPVPPDGIGGDAGVRPEHAIMGDFDAPQRPADSVYPPPGQQQEQMWAPGQQPPAPEAQVGQFEAGVDAQPLTTEQRPEDRPGYQAAMRSGNVHIVNHGRPADPRAGNLRAIGQDPSQWGPPQKTSAGGSVRQFHPNGVPQAPQSDLPPGFDLKPWVPKEGFEPTAAQLQVGMAVNRGARIDKDTWEQGMRDWQAQQEGFARDWRPSQAEMISVQQMAERMVPRGTRNRPAHVAAQARDLMEMLVRNKQAGLRQEAEVREQKRREKVSGEKAAELERKQFALKEQAQKDAMEKQAQGHQNDLARIQAQLEAAQKRMQEQDELIRGRQQGREKKDKTEQGMVDAEIKSRRHFEAQAEKQGKDKAWVDEQVESEMAKRWGATEEGQAFQQALGALPRTQKGEPDFDTADLEAVRPVYNALKESKGYNRLGVTKKRGEELQKAIEDAVKRRAQARSTAGAAAGPVAGMMARPQPAPPAPQPAKPPQQPWYRRMFGQRTYRSDYKPE